MSNRARRAGEPHVASQRQVHSGTDSRTVDRGQGWQRTSGDAQEAFIDSTETGFAGFGEVAEVGACTERGRCSGDHDGTDPRVCFDLVHGFHDLADHRRGERVALLRVVEGQSGDAFGTGHDYERHDPTVASAR